MPATLTETQPLITGRATVQIAGKADAAQCLKVLTRAFEGDPVCQWVWPTRRLHWEAFPRFAGAFGGSAIELGTAHYYEHFAGVALWMPPGAELNEVALGRVLHETVAGARMEAVFSMFEQMESYHPQEEHWHLPLIGVAPESQGRGVGSALLRHACEYFDREQTPAYLEATSPRNVALYERHGFEAMGRIQVADCPEIVPMLRRPR